MSAYPMKDIPRVSDIKKFIRQLPWKQSPPPEVEKPKTPSSTTEDEADIDTVGPLMAGILAENLKPTDLTKPQKKTKLACENKVPPMKTLKTRKFEYTLHDWGFVDEHTKTFITKVTRIKGRTASSVVAGDSFMSRIQLRYTDMSITKSMKNEYEVMMRARKQVFADPTMIVRIRDLGHDPDWKYIIWDNCGYDLHFFLSKMEDRKFSQETTFMIMYYSFQALKELHLRYDFLHLDLKPANFYISMPFRLQLCGFLSATKISDIPKKNTKKMPVDRFSPRSFYSNYKSDNTLTVMDDYESWMYLSMFICEGKLSCSNADNEENLQIKENIASRKNKIGKHDSPDMLCLIPILLNKKKYSISDFYTDINTLFSVEAMSYDERQLLDWGHELPPEKVKSEHKVKKKKSRQLTEKHGDSAVKGVKKERKHRK